MRPLRSWRVPVLAALAMAPLGCASSSTGAAECSVSTCPPDASGSTDAGVLHDGSVSSDASRDATSPGDACSAACPDDGGDGSPPPMGEGGPPTGATTPRMVAYVNVICGFGTGARGGECLATPDPTLNYVQQLEEQGTSPLTHYVLSFLSFQGSSLQTDPGEIWASGGGSTTDFTLEPHVAAALVSAKAHGKKVFLSIGGAAGSSGFLSWWNALGGSSGVAAMGQQIQTAVDAFQKANGFDVDGIDVDIELGGAYAYGSQDYDSTRDLINAVPESLLVAFVPQIGNGLCAAPVTGDPLTATQVLGGECATSSDDDDSAWSLANLDQDCKRADGTPKLDYCGIQYYNAGQATCCGGGPDTSTSIQSVAQSYENLANGWLASNAATDPGGSWPGPWPAFGGIGADRLVLGKPACQGCAGSNYLSPTDMQTLIASLDGKLAKPPGGILFWDLGRIFGNTGSQCVSGTCQPSWGVGGDVQSTLAALRQQMAGLSPSDP